VQLHSEVKDRLSEIRKSRDRHPRSRFVIDKKGPLSNPADRNHCIQYMVAIG